MAGKIGVSDRALVRWLQRTGAMDMEAMRAMLAASLERAAMAAGQLDAARYLIIADGLVFSVYEGTVLGVYEEDGRHASLHARLARVGADRTEAKA